MITRDNGLMFIGAIAAIVLLGACGDAVTSSGAATGSPIASGATVNLARVATANRPANSQMDACALVTQADAAAALGDTVGPPKSGDRGESCQYAGLTGQMPPAMSIILQTGSVANFALLKKMSGAIGGAVSTMAPGLDTALPSVIGDMGTIETVTGLGDDAFWNGGTSNMWVLKGNREFSIQILKYSLTGGGMLPYRTTIIALSQRAIARLTGAPLPSGAIGAPPTPTMAAEMQTVMGIMSAVPATPDVAALTAGAGTNATLAAGMNNMPDAITAVLATLTAASQITAPTDAPTDTPAPPDATDTPAA